MHITRPHNDTPQLSLTINAAIDEAWRAIRDREMLMQWHGWDTPGSEEEINTIYFTDAKEEVSDSGKRT